MKVFLAGFGCKVNQYESAAIAEELAGCGFSILSSDEKCDFYIINTCTVTAEADRKSRQMLHRAKRKNPESVIIAAGCYVQAAKEELEKDPLIDIIIGNNRKKET